MSAPVVPPVVPPASHRTTRGWRNAVELARVAGADRFATETFDKASAAAGHGRGRHDARPGRRGAVRAGEGGPAGTTPEHLSNSEQMGWVRRCHHPREAGNEHLDDGTRVGGNHDCQPRRKAHSTAMTRTQDGHQRRMQHHVLEATEAPSALANPGVGLICAIIPPGTMQPAEPGIHAMSMRVYMPPRYPTALGISPQVVARELSYDFPVGTGNAMSREDAQRT
jgi:hypothetical protein